jgi:bifunctional pyridoxal-dependent enzyme with beta-cystathionase and maltose regulon repressor activities
MAAFFREQLPQFGISHVQAIPGVVRLNFACPRQTLRDALDRIATAVRSIA